MKLLIDTHLLLWAAQGTLSKKAVKYFEDESNELFFSSANIWEVIIKKGLNRKDFQVDANAFYYGLLNNDYTEIPVTSRHALLVAELPPIHKDPFDRILTAQAIAEGAYLLTSDETVAQYLSTIFVD